MQTSFPRSACLIFCLRFWFLCLGSLFVSALSSQVFSAQESQQSREPGPPMRIPRQQAPANAALEGGVRSASGSSAGPLPVAGAVLMLRNNASNAWIQVTASGEGVFRAFPVLPGDYSLNVHANGFADFGLEKLSFKANEVLPLQIWLG